MHHFKWLIFSLTCLLSVGNRRTTALVICLRYLPPLVVRARNLRWIPWVSLSIWYSRSSTISLYLRNIKTTCELGTTKEHAVTAYKSHSISIANSLSVGFLSDSVYCNFSIKRSGREWSYVCVCDTIEPHSNPYTLGTENVLTQEVKHYTYTNTEFGPARDCVLILGCPYYI